KSAEIPVPELILPTGISFYTFAALSYCLDVWGDKIKAERNPFDYMLFVAFFPTLLSGPIERAGHLISQIKEKHDFDADRIKNGFLLMLWGYFLKMVLSDRIAVIVDKVFGEYRSYTGLFSLTAILLYSLQIYFDFASYSCIALGTGEILGFKLISNFERPYFATSVADFWRRWHISLTSFFRDYIYIPLGGNRKGRIRKYVNILVVFALSGLWHGASWKFVFWGVLNGIFQVAGDILKPLRMKISSFTGAREDSFGRRMYRTVFTYILASAAWTFFRADSFRIGMEMLRNCFYYNPWVLFDGSFTTLGIDGADICIIACSLFVVLFVSILNERRIIVREVVERQELWFRWIFYIAAVLTVLVFGMYGPMYDPSDFIYFRF
ncbi:MAG: MBOAT family protein, partial [Lachnospiraceae bacterium]|nr:MBOAT family protein [Lachnospiraceae bacterium]